MPRTSVLIPTSIWRCPDFTSLDMHAQRQFLMLYAHPMRSQAGHLTMTVNRWAKQAADDSGASVRQSLAELEQVGYAAVDDSSDEVVLRLLVPIAGHKRLQGALADVARIESIRLRMVALDRLRELNAAWRPNATGEHRMSMMRLRVYQRDQFRCLHCGWGPKVPDGYDGRYALGDVVLDPASGQYQARLLELDHVFPRSLGGEPTFDNLQTLCNSCNVEKGARV